MFGIMLTHQFPPMEFVVRLRAVDVGNDDSIRHKIKLELMKRASVPGTKPRTKSGANEPE